MSSTERTSAAAFEGPSRIHVGLEVADLDRSIAFYSALFDQDPVKVRPGYAKFEPGFPPVNLSLSSGPRAASPPRPASEHFGVQVQSTRAVEELAQRLGAAGIATRAEEHTSCCYSVQDKVWAEDPDGNPWEVFVVVEADSERHAPPETSCCVGSACGEAGT